MRRRRWQPWLDIGLSRVTLLRAKSKSRLAYRASPGTPIKGAERRLGRPVTTFESPLEVSKRSSAKRTHSSTRLSLGIREDPKSHPGCGPVMERRGRDPGEATCRQELAPLSTQETRKSYLLEITTRSAEAGIHRNPDRDSIEWVRLQKDGTRARIKVGWAHPILQWRSLNREHAA